LQFDRAAIAAGEVWRLATCYLTHFNGEHLLWDLLMFAALGALCEYRNATRMWACVAAGAAAVTATVYWWFPDVYFYRGLSGLDTALFTLLAIEMLHEARREQNRLQAYCVGGLLIGLAAKIAYESIGGQTIFVEQQAAGFVPLVWDHIVGAAVGSIIGACCGSGRGRISYQQLAFRRSAA
jgi:rhomboid family GlyGly-CTERM serine protease